MRPKFVKTYAQLGDGTVAAVRQYIQEVRSGTFPGPEHSFAMDESLLSKL
jgi:3-methyl-2-oxobutanoate hydroxymethyltransferase